MDWELFRQTVRCECGCEVEYVVEHPPIPMIVRGFYGDEGQPVGDDCPGCDRPLVIPKEAP